MLLEAHYGVSMAGGVLVVMNTRLTTSELRYIVEHSGATVLLYDPALADVARELGVATALDSDEYEARLAGSPPVDETSDDEYALVALNYTSGLNGAPTVLIDLAAHPSAHRLDRVVDIGTGGAPPSPTLLARLESLGFRVTHLYGLTETFGPSVICEFPPDWASRPAPERARLEARQGNANIVGVPLRVVDGDEADVPADGVKMGEVVLRGNTVALGYYRDPEATAASFGSGWFHTGDLGVLHPDGYVELTDRAKDIIISGGENIASIEVEQVLARHPDVLEVAVVAAPHERWGEVPHAYVTVVAGAQVTEAELIAFAGSQLAGFKTPKAVHFGPLPKTSTGKIQKFRLRDLGARGR